MAIIETGDLLLPYGSPIEQGQVLTSDGLGSWEWRNQQVGRNAIIGGDFTVNPWQRGTSFTAISLDEYSADRWYSYKSNDAVVDILKTADAPTAAEAGVFTQHCLHADVTTFDNSISTSQYEAIAQKIEGLNVARFGFGQSGTRYVTLSFYHKHTKTGTNCVSFQNQAANRSYIAEYTQSVSDTWEKAIITIPVDTTGTWLYTNDIGLRVHFVLAVGTSLQTTTNSWQSVNALASSSQVNNLDSTSNNFKIALVQLEAGQVATPFDALQQDVGKVLAQCQRYLWRMESADADYIVAGGFAGSTITGLFTLDYPVTMRSEPTLSVSNVADFDLSDGNSNFNTTSIAMSSVANKKHSALITATTSGLTQFRPYALRFDGGGTRYMSFDAEL
jgi:hypothetical protein